MSALVLALYVVIFGGLIYMVAIRPQLSRRRQLQAILTSLAPGDEVVTIAGIHGTVTEIEEGETLLLEVAEDTDIRIAKSAIARKIGPAVAVRSET